MPGLQPLDRRRIEKALRALGPALLLAGMALGLVGVAELTEAAEHGAAPRRPWWLLGGIGLGFAGLLLCQFGYAREMLALFGWRPKERARPPLRTPVTLSCARCGRESGAEANFCAECGAALPLPPGCAARMSGATGGKDERVRMNE